MNCFIPASSVTTTTHSILAACSGLCLVPRTELTLPRPMNTSRTILVVQDTIIEQEAFALLVVEGEEVAFVDVEHPTEAMAVRCIAADGEVDMMHPLVTFSR